MIDEKLKYDEDLLESYSGKWVNLYFFFEGPPKNGVGLHDTEREAVDRYNKIMDNAIKKNNGFAEILIFPSGEKIHYSKITHAIPMPLGDT